MLKEEKKKRKKGKRKKERMSGQASMKQIYRQGLLILTAANQNRRG
jgi:hypothetical protein